MAVIASNPVAGQAFLEFELKLPAKTIPYDRQLIVPEINQVIENIFGYNEAKISFRVNSSAYVDKILKALDANGEPLIRWRMGLGVGETVQWLPWQDYYVSQYSAAFEGVGSSSGYFIKLVTYDQLHLVDRASKTNAHRGTISTIIKSLAADNNITETVIEPTAGDGLWIQCYEGDFEFARRRLLKRASSKRGRGNYFLFTRDNVLHFHTIEYQTALKDFAYYSSPATRLEAVDTAQANIDNGSAGVRVIYHDPYSGRSKEVSSDPNKAVRLANSIPRLDKISRAQLNLREHATLSRDENAGSIALAQNAYEAARADCFQLKMQTSKTMPLRIGELLRIALNPNNAASSAWSGVYLITSASHNINKGELNSVYILQRGEQQVARTNNNDLAAYGVDNLIDDQNAPGYDLNVREAQSSSLTKGAGKATTGGAVLTVQDRNTATVPAQSVKPQT